MRNTPLSGDPLQVISDLHAEASRLTGLSDFGAEEYRQPLERIIRELVVSDLSDIGRAWIHGDFVNALISRLVREQGWKTHPHYRSRRIERPVVICGVPRTGTTALHKVMSLDPQFQGLDHWLTRWPKPRPPHSEWRDEPGYQRAAQRIEDLFELVSGLRAVHEINVEELDECIEILRTDFVTNNFPSSYDVPEYYAWFREQDETPSYHRLADTLRLIGLHDDRTWLLKNPGHIAQLGALLTVFPDARVIITHRDPAKSIGSVASLLSGLWRRVYNHPDVTRLGPRELDYWSRAIASAQDVRSRYPAEQFLDIEHAVFHRDPVGCVHRIYDHFGLNLAPEVEQGMRAWLAANPADKHGVHQYRIDDYGITAEQVYSVMGRSSNG